MPKWVAVACVEVLSAICMYGLKKTMYSLTEGDSWCPGLNLQYTKAHDTKWRVRIVGAPLWNRPVMSCVMLPGTWYCCKTVDMSQYVPCIQLRADVSNSATTWKFARSTENYFTFFFFLSFFPPGIDKVARKCKMSSICRILLEKRLGF